MSFFDLELFISTAVTLTVVTDPAGNLPIFLSLTFNMQKKEKQKIAWQSALVGLGIIITFAVFGSYIFKFLHISVPALQASGGILLLLVSLQLLTGQEGDPGEGGNGVNPAVVPLGTPLLAGPGAIVAVMLAIGETGGLPGKVIAVFSAVLVAILIQWLTFHFGVEISRVLGKGGLSFLTRISGMLVAAIAVELVASGVMGFISQYLTQIHIH